MANTIRASKNTFSGGLVMDLSPDNTPNKVLTSALNATLVTFNGNELLLLNDMGNGRVETARLPDGYIPVGTCEFGDIIYIVSYNPLTNRSQIGCFPSPERNISSEEKGSTGQLLSFNDFQEFAKSNTESSTLTPTGELKASSVKKILYNDKLNPGDKFIIYDKSNQILNETHVSDIGNITHTYGTFPKLLKIHVIAIEDSGKINYLDSTLRWYEHNNEGKDADYFMIPVKEDNATNIPDIDSYRNLLSSGYSVFLSKISGKLALLIELEKIDSFSCTYNVYTGKEYCPEDSQFIYKDCKVYWNFNWNTSDNNINPAYIVLTNSEWVNKDLSVGKGQWVAYEERNNNIELTKLIDYKETLPTKFNESDYWYTKISRLYNPANDDITYKLFIDTESYEVKLLKFIDNVEDTIYVDSEIIDTYLNNSKLIAVYNVVSINEDTLLFNSSYIESIVSIEIDGIKLDEVVSTYRFVTTGEHIVKFTLAEGVASISNNAFLNCSRLINITIPNSIESIGKWAFEYCSGLTNVIIPNSVTSIDSGAFSYCSNLTSITIGNSIESISGSVFYDCSKLINITCNATTAPRITSTTFQNIKSDGTLTVPAGSTGYDVWMGTGDYYLGKYNWTKVGEPQAKILEGNKILCKYYVTNINSPITLYYQELGSDSDEVVPIFSSMIVDGEEKEVTNEYTFDTIGEHIVLFTLPEGIISISDDTFKNCFRLTSIIIPNSVISIGNNVFYNSGLTSITCNTITAPSIQSNTFENIKTNGILTVPVGSNRYDTWLNALPSSWKIKKYTQPYKDRNLVKIHLARTNEDIPDFTFVSQEDSSEYSGKYYINLALLTKDNGNYVARTEYTENEHSKKEWSLYTEIQPIVISDDIVNNYFHTSVTKYFHEFTIPIQQILDGNIYTPDTTNLIYHYEITPAMDYGLLRELSVEGYIDFSKIGTGVIDLTRWKYFNTENSSTLSIGIDAYPEENKGIAEVVMEFYDNQGIAAAYHILNKESYSGTFTEFLPLNGATANDNLNDVDSNNGTFYHVGIKTTEINENVIYVDDNEAKPLYFNNGEWFNDPTFSDKHTRIDDLYINDAGTLYSNILYLVKIVVKYCQKDSLGNLDTSVSTDFKEFYRWYWTNTMYNDKYYTVSDFDILPFELELDTEVVYDVRGEGNTPKTLDYHNPYMYLAIQNGEVFRTTDVKVLYIAGENNTKYGVSLGLRNTYNTFSLRGSKKDNTEGSKDTGAYSDILFHIFTDCHKTIKNYKNNEIADDIQIRSMTGQNYDWIGIKPLEFNNDIPLPINDWLYDALSNVRYNMLEYLRGSGDMHIWNNWNNYDSYRNDFKLLFNGTTLYNGNDYYMTSESNLETLNGKYYVLKSYGEICDINDDYRHGEFTTNAIHYSKYFYVNWENTGTRLPCLTPLLWSFWDYEAYNIGVLYGDTGWGYPYVKTAFGFEIWDDGNGDNQSRIRVHKYAFNGGSYLHTGQAIEYCYGDDETLSVFSDNKLFYRNDRSSWNGLRNMGFFLYSLVRSDDDSSSHICGFDRDNHPSGEDIWNVIKYRIGSYWDTLYNRGYKGENTFYGYTITPNYVDRYIISTTKYLEYDGTYVGSYAYDMSHNNGKLFGVGFCDGPLGEYGIYDHYFNTFFPVLGNNTSRIEFSETYENYHIPKYIGCYIVSILSNMYRYNSTGGPHPVTNSDIVFLENHSTIYTLDIVYKAFVKSETNHNTLLLIRGIIYDDPTDDSTDDSTNGYKQLVLENCLGNNYDILVGKLNMNNVDLKLKGCIKTFPISYSIAYQTPNTSNYGLMFNSACIYKNDENQSVVYVSNNLDPNTLYWLDSNGNLRWGLTTDFEAPLVDSLRERADRVLLGRYWDTWMKFPNVSKIFSYRDGRLYDDNRDKGSYGLFSMRGRCDADMVLQDLRKDEVLIPIGNMMEPWNIPTNL